MGLKRAVVRLLDRPGGRVILGALATWSARRASGSDIRIFHDDVWLHGADSRYLADAVNFEYQPYMLPRLKSQAQALDREAHDYWFHCYQPRAGDIIVDVGAGAGTDTRVFAEAVQPNGKVLAIEAHPVTYRLLRAACKCNRLSNVITCHRAAMDKRCTVYIEDRPERLDNRVSLDRAADMLAEAVPGAPLDELCAEHGLDRIDYLKMNIEGAEQAAILGMKEMIRRTRYVTIACHDFRAEAGESAEAFATKKMVAEFLQANGFQISTRQDARPYVRDHVHGVNREA